MNMDKRYCQNRERKRKRTIPPSPVQFKNISPAEEERQFKLRRFVDDVGKFLSEKEVCPGQKIVSKRKSSTQTQGTVKKVAISKQVNIPKVKRSLPQNGIQTKFYTRGVSGVMTREMTARLDDNMRRIISLGSNNQCHCTHHCRRQFESNTGSLSPKWGMDLQRPSMLESLRTRLSSNSEDLQHSPSPQLCVVGGDQVATTSNSLSFGKSLTELDNELYPLFTRVVSVSCTQTKSTLFKNQSYASAAKRKLLEIYLNGVKHINTSKMKDNKRVLSCLSEHQKATSSVDTSFLPSSESQSSLYNNKDTFFKLKPSKLPIQSTMQFLEESIGPSSTSTNKQMILSPPYHQLQQSLLSPPVVGCQRPQQLPLYVPKMTKHTHEPMFPSSPPVSHHYNFRSKDLGGSGDGLHFNRYNSFLPPIEEEDEDSPDFRYYPRKIF